MPAWCAGAPGSIPAQDENKTSTDGQAMLDVQHPGPGRPTAAAGRVWASPRHPRGHVAHRLPDDTKVTGSRKSPQVCMSSLCIKQPLPPSRDGTQASHTALPLSCTPAQNNQSYSQNPTAIGAAEGHTNHPGLPRAAGPCGTTGRAWREDGWWIPLSALRQPASWPGSLQPLGRSWPAWPVPTASSAAAQC